MKKGDVQIAISDAFRKQFSELKFSRDYNFIGFDNTSNICFTIQGEYDGPGDYRIEGAAGLLIDDNGNTQSKNYNLSFYVKVENEDDSPKITFPDFISVRLR